MLPCNWCSFLASFKCFKMCRKTRNTNKKFPCVLSNTVINHTLGGNIFLRKNLFYTIKLLEHLIEALCLMVDDSVPWNSNLDENLGGTKVVSMTNSYTVLTIGCACVRIAITWRDEDDSTPILRYAIHRHLKSPPTTSPYSTSGRTDTQYGPRNLTGFSKRVCIIDGLGN